MSKLFLTPWAVNGDKTPPIPDAQQLDGSVSYTTGYGPDYEKQLGVDPSAKNIKREGFNAVLNDITLALQQIQAGSAGVGFSSIFAAALPGAGYAKGAVLPRSDFNGFWFSTTAANADNPETIFGKWLPFGVKGSFSQALTNANVTLSLLNAGYPQLNLSGTLTADVQLIVPAWLYSYRVVNSCVGSFTVTVKTASGTGVIIANGATTVVYSSSTGVTLDVTYRSGELIGVQAFTVSGTYTPTPGMATCIAEGLAGGGAGGGAPVTIAGNVGFGAGGHAGAYGKGRFTAAQIGVSQPVTIGAGGVATTNSGGNGGQTSLGTLMVLPGGAGGPSAGNTAPPLSAGNGNVPSVASAGANLIRGAGQVSSIGLIQTTSVGFSGAGANSPYGSGGGAINNTAAGQQASGLGSGGSGAAAFSANGTARLGGNGAPGFMVIEEYA